MTTKPTGFLEVTTTGGTVFRGNVRPISRKSGWLEIVIRIPEDQVREFKPVPGLIENQVWGGNINELLVSVAGFASVKADALLSGCRTRDLAYTRFMCFRILRKNGASLHQIARFLNMKDHGSVLYGLKKLKDLIDHDQFYRTKFTQLLTHLGLEHDKYLKDL